MKKGLKAMLLGGLLFVSASTVSAIPLPSFILYGQADDGTQVTAKWNDGLIASAVAEGGYFKLSIAMDTDSSYKSGAVIELWINDTPTGQMETIGDFGAAREIKLNGLAN